MQQRIVINLIDIYRKVIDKITNLQFLRRFIHSKKVFCAEQLKLSKRYSSNIKSLKNYGFRDSPERNLYLSSVNINIKKDSKTYHSYCNLRQKVLPYLNSKANLKLEEIQWEVATNTKNNLIKTTDTKFLKNELYRTVKFPLIQFPSIIDLLVSEEFKNTFAISHPLLKISDVQLRFTKPSKFESHTMGFHRDYESFYVIKLFIPLSSYRLPFLEYFPFTELSSASSIHYRPRKISENKLPNRIKKLKRAF